MNGEQLNELSIWLQAIETVGTIAVLAIFIYLFYSGKIVSSKIHDEIVEVYKKLAVDMTEDISSKLDELSSTNKKCLTSVSRSINKMAKMMKDVKKILQINSGGKA